MASTSCNRPSMRPYGKPHPAVYIECARTLGIAPADCLALEDSPAGVLAAKAARMTCIAIPPPELRDDPRYCIADLQLDSIEQFSAQTVTALGRDVAVYSSGSRE